VSLGIKKEVRVVYFDSSPKKVLDVLHADAVGVIWL